MDVINARIPAPAAGSATAQVEVTLADTGTAGPGTLLAATSPAARAVIFTSNGHAVPRITIPVAAGSSLSTGPPHPDRFLPTGLRGQLRTGRRSPSPWYSTWPATRRSRSRASRRLLTKG
jgi:hypothetical protein